MIWYNTYIQPIFTLSVAGSVASIIGVGVSLFVLIKIRHIQQDYMFKIRIPKILKSIESCASEIQELFEELPESLPNVKANIGVAIGNLNNLKGKLKKDERKSIKNLIGRLSRLKDITSTSSNYNPDEIWNAYTTMLQVIAEVDNLYTDRVWGHEDG